VTYLSCLASPPTSAATLNQYVPYLFTANFNRLSLHVIIVSIIIIPVHVSVQPISIAYHIACPHSPSISRLPLSSLLVESTFHIRIVSICFQYLSRSYRSRGSLTSRLPMASIHVRPSQSTLSVSHAMTYLSGHIDPVRIAAVLLDEMSQLFDLYKIDVNQPRDDQLLHNIHPLTNSGVHTA
jgi:hypothetical protein